MNRSANEPEALRAAPTSMPLDLVWQGLETLLRHILTATEKIQWDLALQGEQARALPDLTNRFEEMQAVLRAESRASAEEQGAHLADLRRQSAELAAIAGTLTDKLPQHPPGTGDHLAQLEAMIEALAQQAENARAEQAAQGARLGAVLERILLLSQNAADTADQQIPLPGQLQGLERGQQILLDRLAAIERHLSQGHGPRAGAVAPQGLRPPRRPRKAGHCCGD